MGFEEILESTAFWLLTGVGYIAFFFMLVILKSMGQSSIMPFWVKVITIVLIPLVAALFSGFAEG